MMIKMVKIPNQQDQRIAHENLDAVEKIVQKHHSARKPIEIEITGEKTRIKIPPSAFRYLNTILQLMAKGKAITIIPSDTEISTQQAADMLNVSRPHVIKLLEKGELPYHKVRTHRRIKLKDLEDYKAKMDKKRHKLVEELTKQAQELDLGY
ncbi:MAG TPA: helix-turn-helix domain-containing protein [Bacteroidales bacterium]|nr:helix-turn-helix domain-containing protein [Bacteroidales bacterium]